MAEPAVGLGSLGGVARWLDDSVTAMLTQTIAPLLASITAKILPFVTICLTISLMWYGWLIASGSIREPVFDALRRISNIVVIVAIAGAGGLYQTQIAEVMLELPAAIASLFTDTAQTPADFMDDAANNGAEIGTHLNNRAPSGLSSIADALVFGIVSVAITVVSALMSAVGMIMLITVKIGMGLVVILGPFCILMLLFDSTKSLFSKWLGQALFYSFYAGLYMLVFMFVMGMFGMLQQGFLDSTAADQINIFSMLVAIVVFVMCAIGMLAQVPTVVAAVTGGKGGAVTIPFIGRIG